MAPSVELVHRFRPWCAVWPPKIDPKAAQHEKPGDEDEPVSALPPDASRRRIFAHGNQDLLLPSKTSELYTLLLLSSRAKPRDLLLAFVARGLPRASTGLPPGVRQNATFASRMPLRDAFWSRSRLSTISPRLRPIASSSVGWHWPSWLQYKEFPALARIGHPALVSSNVYFTQVSKSGTVRFA